MLALALALLVSGEEPSSPPLLPAEPGTRHTPYVPPAPAVEYDPSSVPGDAHAAGRDPDLADTEAREAVDAEVLAEQRGEVSFHLPRVIATGATAGLIGGTLVGVAMAFERSTTGSEGVIVALLSLPVSLFLGTGVAWFVHRAMYGQGSWGSHLAGGAIGGAAGLVATALIVFVGDKERMSPGAWVGSFFALSGLFGGGTALMAELSNSRTLREHHVSLSVLPVREGAVAVAGATF